MICANDATLESINSTTGGSIWTGQRACRDFMVLKIGRRSTVFATPTRIKSKRRTNGEGLMTLYVL
ncbi:hypothetical protein EV356DRAFT_51960 [Viridothelium virens]|uniref:Uncharacterized protein n=1 Tax=Viridothelium virens TaxID=1048519 RepID=A0A6A6HFX0_VIRVR|nr:hypothetical protein EV356DRAFT_51960 [Viridothelium virens]